MLDIFIAFSMGGILALLGVLAGSHICYKFSVKEPIVEIGNIGNKVITEDMMVKRDAEQASEKFHEALFGVTEEK